MATARAREGAERAPASHYRHMQTMFGLFMRSGSGRGLRMGAVGLNDLYAVYCAGFIEGVWTERARRGKRKEVGGGED